MRVESPGVLVSTGSALSVTASGVRINLSNPYKGVLTWAP